MVSMSARFQGKGLAGLLDNCSNDLQSSNAASPNFGYSLCILFRLLSCSSMSFKSADRFAACGILLPKNAVHKLGIPKAVLKGTVWVVKGFMPRHSSAGSPQLLIFDAHCTHTFWSFTERKILTWRNCVHPEARSAVYGLNHALILAIVSQWRTVAGIPVSVLV